MSDCIEIANEYATRIWRSLTLPQPKSYDLCCFGRTLLTEAWNSMPAPITQLEHARAGNITP